MRILVALLIAALEVSSPPDARLFLLVAFLSEFVCYVVTGDVAVAWSPKDLEEDVLCAHVFAVVDDLELHIVVAPAAFRHVLYVLASREAVRDEQDLILGHGVIFKYFQSMVIGHYFGLI